MSDKSRARGVPIPSLLQLLVLGWRFARVGCHVLVAIANLNVDRADAVGPLVGALGDQQWEVRKAAAWSLGEIGPAATLTTMTSI